MENYLHIHPAIREVEEVQEVLQIHYCQYDSEGDSSDEEIENEASEKMTEHLKYVQNLPMRMKKKVRMAVAQANDEMIQRAVRRYGPLDPAVFKRLKVKGAYHGPEIFLPGRGHVRSTNI